ncbi:MAG: HAD-IIIC family phosphatase [Deltaproteobacteria bacterium]|nr:HAD-IIIC family phosphatase [Deltaproteobacteria bacterium]
MTPDKNFFDQLKKLLAGKEQSFWELLADSVLKADSFSDFYKLSQLRKKAAYIGLAEPRRSNGELKVAFLGGYTLFPLHDLIELQFWAKGFKCAPFVGEYDNYVAEMLDGGNALHSFNPDLIFVWPSPRIATYTGKLTDEPAKIRQKADQASGQILQLCHQAHEALGSEIILANFAPYPYFDPGPFRTRTLASDWNFRRLINMEIGLTAPRFVHICDVEFLACRKGALSTVDRKRWFESKQPAEFNFLVELAKEVVHTYLSVKSGPKKILVADADNTLWGGVIGDDGLSGIDIGRVSPRGEAFIEFQVYLKKLRERGVLLGLCSKNNIETVMEVFEKHPEMVLKKDDFVSMKVNWEPKSENIKQMAKELSILLDSFVFVDDNPAEIDIVSKFAPEVTSVLLPDDPSLYVSTLQDLRLFEPITLTEEDGERTDQYQSEKKRQELFGAATDMNTYLESLQMEGRVSLFVAEDIPRIAQLINKSNQFNLTTIRRSESDVERIMKDSQYHAFTVRLADRFGDHGLISVVICRVKEQVLEIDTWLMSCRVLQRQVEELVLNEIVKAAKMHGCNRVEGIYIPTAKNKLVENHYVKLGFQNILQSSEKCEYELKVEGCVSKNHLIKIVSSPQKCIQTAA